METVRMTVSAIVQPADHVGAVGADTPLVPAGVVSDVAEVAGLADKICVTECGVADPVGPVQVTMVPSL
ncbi:hypothetical protein GCM10025858_14320 [Alicyclobacillus sacchari]|nr:hypothetical protein GCM10025858_14320 [Alicyclobacillus sacchari]